MVDAQRFSVEERWDFTDAKHRKAFMKKAMVEELDSALLSPICKLWSIMHAGDQHRPGL